MRVFILVGDEAKARLFRAERIGDTWELDSEYVHPESRAKAEDLLTDRPSHEENGMPRRDHEGAKFAHLIGQTLERRQAEFQRLVLVGPPRFLGLLRAELTGPVGKKISDTLNKSLTDLNERDLRSRLAGELGI